MSRPLRLEYEGALYHVTARGNSGQKIYTRDHDRKTFLSLLGREIEQQRWLCHAYALMETHFHLLLETPEPNLSRGMRRLNGSYSQWFNCHYRRHGHLLQGRYKAIVVEKESYLLELCRYIVLNPVRARMVPNAAHWRWSSYRATAGMVRRPVWLCTDWVLSQFGSRRSSAQKAYRGFVSDGLVGDSPWKNLRGQIYLGSTEFLRSIGARIEQRGMDLEDVPRAMRVPDRPTAKDIAEAVGSSLGVPTEEVFNRKQHQDAYRLMVYLLRRVANMTRRDVAAMAGICPPRVSQIQSWFDNPNGHGPLLSGPQIQTLLKNYKVTR